MELQAGKSYRVKREVFNFQVISCIATTASDG